MKLSWEIRVTMKSVILAAIALAAAQAVSVYDVVLDEWKLFKADARRFFRSSGEEYGRLRTFLESKKLVALHNRRFRQGLVDFELELNDFADWLPYRRRANDEGMTKRFMEDLAQLRMESRGIPIEVPPFAQAPVAMDWARAGAVTPPMAQLGCGCCYAVASAAALESQVFLEFGVAQNLSVQQIVDCSRNFGNSGCGGGTFENTFRYFMSSGLTTTNFYPFKGKDSGSCELKGHPVTPNVTAFMIMTDGNEHKLKYALANLGPMAVGINTELRNMHLYKGGIYSDPACGSRLNHAVLLTGYGVDPKGKEYWIIKNTWGTGWGEKGYLKLARNKKNMCGIGTLAYVPQFG